MGNKHCQHVCDNVAQAINISNMSVLMLHGPSTLVTCAQRCCMGHKHRQHVCNNITWEHKGHGRYGGHGSYIASWQHMCDNVAWAMAPWPYTLAMCVQQCCV